VLARAFLLILPDAGRTPAGAEVGRGDAAEGGGFSWWRRRLSGFRVRGNCRTSWCFDAKVNLALARPLAFLQVIWRRNCASNLPLRQTHADRAFCLVFHPGGPR